MTKLDWTHSKKREINKTNINEENKREGAFRRLKEMDKSIIMILKPNKSKYLICNAEEVFHKKSGVNKVL